MPRKSARLLARIVLLLALGPACVLARPARAADIKTIDCVTNALDPSVIAAVGAEARIATGETGIVRPPDSKPQIDSAAEKCAANNHWSEAATALAIDHMRAGIIMPLIERKMRADGNDPVIVERVLRELPKAQLGVIVSGQGQGDGTAMAALIAHMGAAKVKMQTEAQLSGIGMLAVAIFRGDAALANFPSA